MTPQIANVPKLSRTVDFPEKPSLDLGAGKYEVIDAPELARRWNVPESWVRDRTRGRTPKADRIPHLKLGRYTRFAWGSPALTDWLMKQQG
jgi:hypothetical protein